MALTNPKKLVYPTSNSVQNVFSKSPDEIMTLSIYGVQTVTSSIN